MIVHKLQLCLWPSETHLLLPAARTVCEQWHHTLSECKLSKPLLACNTVHVVICVRLCRCVWERDYFINYYVVYSLSIYTCIYLIWKSHWEIITGIMGGDTGNLTGIITWTLVLLNYSFCTDLFYYSPFIALRITVSSKPKYWKTFIIYNNNLLH